MTNDDGASVDAASSIEPDEEWFAQVEATLTDGIADKEYATDFLKLLRRLCIEYAELQTARKDARIVELETALSLSSTWHQQLCNELLTRTGREPNDVAAHPLLNNQTE